MLKLLNHFIDFFFISYKILSMAEKIDELYEMFRLKIILKFQIYTYIYIFFLIFVLKFWIIYRKKLS